MSCPPAFARAASSVALAAAVPIALAACTRTGPTPEPAATLLAAPWTAVPATADSAAPPAAAGSTGVPSPLAPPTATLTTGELMAVATTVYGTIAALTAPAAASGAATPIAPPPAIHTAVPGVDCRVLGQQLDISLGPAFGMSADQRTRWAEVFDWRAPVRMTARVLDSIQLGQRTALTVSEHGTEFMAEIDSTVGLGLHAGQAISIVVDQDTRQAAPEPRGSGLIVRDDAGTVAVVVAVRETPGADARLLGGDRGGFVVRQLPSACAEGVVDACGYTLRPAAVSFALGDETITLGPDTSGTLPAGAGHAAYRIDVGASYVWTAGDALPCPDPRHVVLAYAIQRQ